uniref:Uncharacterized protein n=1 Tax=Rhizophora mucronata TaxID=61149 RepID=A0A2P2IM37_RHIMU
MELVEVPVIQAKFTRILGVMGWVQLEWTEGKEVSGAMGVEPLDPCLRQ